MRVICRHGHFAFYPETAGEIARFCEYYRKELVRQEDFYTFPLLKELENYSLPSKPYGGFPAIETFEGNPWDVMRANGLVYSLNLEILVPKSSIMGFVDAPLSTDYFIASTPLIQAGLRNSSGAQVLSYDGRYLENVFELRISEFSHE